MYGVLQYLYSCTPYECIYNIFFNTDELDIKIKHIILYYNLLAVVLHGIWRFSGIN